MKIRGTPWRIGITLIGTSLAAIVFLSACNTAPTAVNRPATARNVTGPAGTPQELLNRLHHALQTGDASDAAVTLIALAERFPSKLKDAPDADVRGAAEGALTVNDGGKLERQVLEVLFRAGWTASVGIEASILWVRLARMRLDDKDRAGAREAAARVTAPYERIAMYADLRFDSVMARDSRAEDVRKAGQREIDEIQALARHRPRSMLTVVWLESSLRHMQRYSEALEVNEAVLGTQLDATKRHVQVPFDDIGYLSAIMNGKAYALWGLGSFEEAAREMDAARRLLENGRPNVSETLNMAEMYCRLGEHEQARKVVGDLGSPENLSGYGRMVLEQVNFLAALEAGDSLDMNAALKYLQTHAGDGPHVALWSSVIAGDFPNADAILHNELLNPDRRGAFLIRVQRYADAPMTPQQQQWAAAWQAWVTRPQVQAEVSKWGRIDRYPVEDPN